MRPSLPSAERSTAIGAGVFAAVILGDPVTVATDLSLGFTYIPERAGLGIGLSGGASASLTFEAHRLTRGICP